MRAVSRSEIQKYQNSSFSLQTRYSILGIWCNFHSLLLHGASHFLMYVARFCRYRWAPDGALRAASFVAAYSTTMNRNPSPAKKMELRSAAQSLQPQPRRDRRRRNRGQQRESEPVSDTSPTSAPLSPNADATMQRIEVIAQSLEQVSIAREPSASATPSLQPGPGTGTSIGSPRPRPKRGNGKDEKVPPSKGSGGIPSVSEAYLQASNVVSQPLGEPQNLLVVIDLNGTLVYRPSRTAPRKFLTRPHAPLFLKYCLDTFTVVIWSSARPENVKAMCEAILPPALRRRVVAIWGRDKFNLTPEDYNLRVQCYKRLDKIWSDPVIAASHPAYLSGGRWDQTNTVLIDDSLEKARSEPHNLIEVPEWLGDLNEADEILPQVHDHLNYLSMHSNVSACLRANPFKPRIGYRRATAAASR